MSIYNPVRFCNKSTNITVSVGKINLNNYNMTTFFGHWQSLIAYVILLSKFIKRVMSKVGSKSLRTARHEQMAIHELVYMNGFNTPKHCATPPF